MKIIHNVVPLEDDPYTLRYFEESAAFFDIETTGLSAKTSFVYLIGLAVRAGRSAHVWQFLAQDRADEAGLIHCFYEKICQASVIITFNGNGFDLPFLKKREQALGISHDWDAFSWLDLYRESSRLARILSLADKKQKTIELFLGIRREDRYSGGDLISVFFSYEKQGSADLEELLLLHNYEDVVGMQKLLPLLSYRDFFAAPPAVLQTSVVHEADGEALALTLSSPVPFPKQALCRDGSCSLMFRKRDACLLARAVQGEMRFFYDNYKDYYYLPDEDMAIHKNVAVYADASHRKKATAANCYTRRFGTFLPQGEPLFAPCFYPGKKTKASYFELTRDFLSDPDASALYASHLLKQFYKSR